MAGVSAMVTQPQPYRPSLAYLSSGKTNLFLDFIFQQSLLTLLLLIAHHTFILDCYKNKPNGVRISCKICVRSISVCKFIIVLIVRVCISCLY